MSTHLMTSRGPTEGPMETPTPGFMGIVGKADALIKRAGHSVAEEFAQTRDLITDGACGAAKVTNAYVRANPWKVVGAVAAAGLVLGTLLSRR